MSMLAYVLTALVAAGLLAVLVYLTVHEMHREAEPRLPDPVESLSGAPTRAPDHASMRPLRILLAIDGSAGSAAAVNSLIERPWPPGSELELLTVIHTDVPYVPDMILGGAAAHRTALDEERKRAPVHIQAARERLSAMTGVALYNRIVEGDPSELILDEARRFHADLIVLGADGHGRAHRALLGSVPRRVARQAPCSVELVRPSAAMAAAS